MRTLLALVALAFACDGHGFPFPERDAGGVDSGVASGPACFPQPLAEGATFKTGAGACGTCTYTDPTGGVLLVSGCVQDGYRCVSVASECP